MKKGDLIVATAVVAAFLLSTCCPHAFAVEEEEVEAAITAAGREAVTGNIFIWFLCAVGFLKVSQKIDEFLSSLGLNVGHTGGRMLTELAVAAKTITNSMGGAGRLAGSILTGSSRTAAAGAGGTAAGMAFTGSAGGIIGAAQRAAGNAAASSVTGRGNWFTSRVGGSLFNSSMASQDNAFSTSVIGAVARGSMASVGSITGETAIRAFNSYMAPQTTVEQAVSGSNVAVDQSTRTGVTLDGGGAGRAADSTVCGGPAATGHSIPFSAAYGTVGMAADGTHEIFDGVPAGTMISDIEIGGGRITGNEMMETYGEMRRFAMYSTEQYMAPDGEYEIVRAADGTDWYRQYAQPTVKKEPYEAPGGNIRYCESIVYEMPQIPKRKDKV